MHIIGCFTLLLFLVVVLLMLAPVILLNFVRRFLGGKSNKTSQQWRSAGNDSHQYHQQHQQSREGRSHAKSAHSRKHRKGTKIFQQNEGEYVEFEEVKE